MGANGKRFREGMKEGLTELLGGASSEVSGIEASTCH